MSEKLVNEENISAENAESEAIIDSGNINDTEETHDEIELTADADAVADTKLETSSPTAETLEEEQEEVEEILSEDVKKQNHEEALEHKVSGNKLFRNAEYQCAIDKYADGIKICPKSFAKSLAILHSNRAACLMKLDEKEQAILDCTKALEYDEYYTKARLRRAQTYETLDKLDEALKDYNEILTYDKSCQAAGEAAMRLPGQINERNEKLKQEMFGKK